MNEFATSTPRTRVDVTCSACGAATSVPFTPTPGRPVYCRACFDKRPAPGPGAAGPRGAARGPPRAGGRGGPFRPRENDLNRSAPRKRMLSQGRKAHFVYDALEALAKEGAMAEDQRRAFVEMLFTRGARQSADAAHEFIVEKHGDKTITDREADKLARLVQEYSFRR